MEILTILFCIYVAPAFVAAMRRHQQVGAILALNLLLGWTLVGWVAALVWALVKPETQPAAPFKGTGTNPDDGRMPCPRCAEQIMRQAQVCRFCGHEMPAPIERPVIAPQPRAIEQIVPLRQHGRDAAPGGWPSRDVG